MGEEVNVRPTVSQVIGGLLDNAVKNPRTTVSSLLTAAMGGIPLLLASGHLSPKVSGILGGALMASKVLWGAFFQKDAKPLGQVTVLGSAEITGTPEPPAKP